MHAFYIWHSLLWWLIKIIHVFCALKSTFDLCFRRKLSCVVMFSWYTTCYNLNHVDNHRVFFLCENIGILKSNTWKTAPKVTTTHQLPTNKVNTLHKFNRITCNTLFIKFFILDCRYGYFGAFLYYSMHISLVWKQLRA